MVVRRAGNAEWIRFIGMDRIAPRPGAPGQTRQWAPFDLDFDRVVTAVEGDRLTLDAPLTCAIEERWGGGLVIPYTEGGRIHNVGIERLRAVSSFDRSVLRDYRGEKYFADERHCREMVRIENAANVWVRNVTAVHFVYSCVSIGRGSKWVTVRDCACLDMVSEITGSRRYPYSVSGQLCLVERCAGDTGRHDFAVGSRVCGPNVFLDCRAGKSYATSEPHHRWSVGGLYDNVRAGIAIQDRQYYGTGHGWAGANYVAWNCEGPLVCQKPPGAQNWAIGHVGAKAPGRIRAARGRLVGIARAARAAAKPLSGATRGPSPQAAQRLRIAPVPDARGARVHVDGIHVPAPHREAHCRAPVHRR